MGGIRSQQFVNLANIWEGVSPSPSMGGCIPAARWNRRWLEQYIVDWNQIIRSTLDVIVIIIVMFFIIKLTKRNLYNRR